MNTTETTENLVLEIRRSFPVTRERLFAAWTDPGEIRLWFGPEGVSVVEAQMDLKPGGKYLISTRHTDDEIWTCTGEFREVTPPARLVYTWGWKDDEDWAGVDSVVTVEFNEQPGGAELHLTHRKFPSAESRDRHQFGWNGCLDKLARLVQK